MIFVLLGSGPAVFADERILLFDQEITVNVDGSMDVLEHIKVRTEQERIVHGITRALPLRYRLHGIFQQRHPLTITSITRDGQKESFTRDHMFAGDLLLVGSKHIYLPPGVYDYTIGYRTDRFIGFFKEHDELYWNVVGTEMQFPVDRARAVVHLPKGVPSANIMVATYSGYAGSREQSYARSAVTNTTVVIESTRMLQPHQAFTIVVGWPKGFVLEPSFFMRVTRAVFDNFHWMLLCIGFLLSLLLVVRSWRRRVIVIKRAVIPLFEAPEGYSPSMCRYLLKRRSDSVGFAADVVGMAVHGLLTIGLQEGLWRSSYVIKKNQEEPDNVSDIEREIEKRLFAKGDEVVLSRSEYNSAIHNAFSYIQTMLSRTCWKFFVYPIYLLVFIALIAVVVIAAALVVSQDFIVLFFALLFLIEGAIAWKLLSGYTQDGQELVEKIQGLQLFLRTVETDRLAQMVSVKESPAVYEKFLPYAIALDAEREWTSKFAPLFNHLKQEYGIIYHPMWFYGPRFSGDVFDTNFSSGFSSGFSSAMGTTLNLSSSSTTSSGFSGGSSGGRSGGGGGGGGVGGW
jgi:uncharacterized membrane protein YgcG